ncbi:gas vesicle protein [Paenibacillus sp. GCM10023248]|uniref:gas vesicle protein n=1 Tax=Bacillales TaxID=1385 RepID=UPI00237926E3|nr:MULTISPECIES: gas vesicle protein [Bacillales]MDD9268633.1 gas vesicle protein [Paenibacillus sp. MAHUQ-63]MDR6879537.1 hypothetical protein [Bacillus sp. 3255]
MHQNYRNKEMTLLDILDGLIDKGAVVSGELIISVADIDLIYVDLKLLIASVQSILEQNSGDQRVESHQGWGSSNEQPSNKPNSLTFMQLESII